jgi:hypothetical protein
VSHFYLLIKNKLTTYFKTLFVSKKEGYDLSQNDFTNELKAKLENMDGSGGTDGAEDEIYIITVTMTGERSGEITRDTADFLQNYTGDKPLYMKVEPIGLYLAYDSTSGIFCIARAGEIINAEVNTDTLECWVGVQKLPSLDTDGKLSTFVIPKLSMEHLPDLGFYDDVVEGYLNPEDSLFYKDYRDDLIGMGVSNLYDRLITGESGKLYVDLHTSHSYRWSGSTFVKLESSAGLTALTNTEIDEIIASVDSSTE